MGSTRDRFSLDKLDIKILSALGRDGRMTKLQLSEEVYLSATPCWERMKKLEKSGVIKGYHARFDIRSLTGVSYSRVEITMQHFSISNATIFEKFIKTVPEVIECESVLGNVDFILKILSRNIEEYLQIIERIHIDSGVNISHKTFPVSKVVKEPNQVDIQQLYEIFMEN